MLFASGLQNKMGLTDTEMCNPKNRMMLIAAWAAVFAGAIFAYMPGLAGPFVLDDFGSIGRLGDFNGVRDWQTFKAFVFSGTAGPTGRPLSLLSFLLDANNWPADPFPFKRTNLIIHLLNGALIGLMIAKLLEALRYERVAIRWISLVAAGCWMLHPFLVSTTLYSVQRMAQLATLFMIAGVVVWIYGRAALATNAKRGYLIMSLSLPLFTFLAMVSKENGILLPLLIGVIELTVFNNDRASQGRLDKRWILLFVMLPAAIIFAYLGERVFQPSFFEVLPPRDFSIYERLLTQPRIIVDYLQNWYIPKLYTTGIFQDHVLKSTGLFAPPTTAMSAVLILGMLIVAFWYRRRWPLVALAILFFFTSHLLESTVLNLELYFEHRNYMGASLLFLPLIAMLWHRTNRIGFVATAVAIMLMLGGFTRYSASVWSSYPSIVEASAMKASTSARAQSQYAMLLFNANRHEEGMRVLDDAIDNIPGDNPFLLVNKLIAKCNMQTLEPREFEETAAVISELAFDARMLKAYNDFAKAVVTEKCPAITLRSILPLFTKMLQNPRNADPSSIEYTHIKFLIGYVKLYLGEIDKAMVAFEESLAARPGASYAMAMAALFASSGFPQQALYLSNIALTQLDTKNNTTLVGRRANEKDIREFQAIVNAELAGRRDVDTAAPVHQH
jgi:tetratricopeptide (TPR) repeat protein